MDRDERLIVPGAGIGRRNSMGMLREIVGMTGQGSRLFVFSYSVTDGWLRQLAKLRQDAGISHITLVLDHDVMVRHREKMAMMGYVADEVYLTESHAKLYLSEGKETTVALITSANATNNYRIECYYATDRPGEIEQIKGDIRGILESAVRIDG